MKSKLIIIIFITILFSCSKEENIEEILTVKLEAIKTTVVVDEIAKIQVTTNKPIHKIEYSLDNFNPFPLNLYNRDLGSSLTVYVNTETVGEKNVTIKVYDANGNNATSAISIKIEKGNAIQLKELIVANFYNKDKTWDTEFSDTDPNSLTDVFFTLSKPRIDIFKGRLSQELWYKSSIKENQGDLTWNLLQENLYVNPNALIHFGLADDDGGGVGQDLLLGPPFEKEINLAQHSSSQPNSITLEDTSINLDVDFAVEW